MKWPPGMADMLRTLRTAHWFHADGFPIAVERREPQAPFGPHRHEFSEIVLVTGGSGLHVTGRESWPLSAGDAFVIGGPRAHEYRNLADLRLINILFQPRRLRFGPADLRDLPGYRALFGGPKARPRRPQFHGRLRLAPRQLGIALGLVDQLGSELRERAPGFRFVATAVFMQLVAHLSRCHGRSRDSNSKALGRIAGTLAHLEAHYEKPVRLGALASLARMSKRSFLRAFHAATGTTPIAYLIQLRVNRAAALLRHSDDRVTEVAFRVGFSDSNYFTRQFRRLLGCSPRAYRRRQAGAP
jgi:AraC-like DNA-binding protein